MSTVWLLSGDTGLLTQVKPDQNILKKRNHLPVCDASAARAFNYFGLTLDLAPGCTLSIVPENQLQIGEVAALAGVSVDAVRYYEKRRLLNRAPRTAGNFRLFTSDAVERIRFIKQAQEMGLSLDEIKVLLTSDGGATQCQRLRDLLKEKITSLDHQMKKLREFRRTLSHHLAACENELTRHGAAASCPVIVKMKHRQGRG